MDIKLPKVAPEGNVFIVIFAIITFVLLLISTSLGIIGIILTIWCVAFFRDPERITPQHKSLIVAPADGKIIKIEKVIPPAELGISEEMIKISIFMNVFNVHINRSPCAGVIEKIIYYPGKFFNASLDKASLDNERQSFIMKTTQGHQVAFVQIAGLVARRIVKFVEENIEVNTGDKIGLIRFGSRVDVYIPSNITPLVHEGQITIAGETILSDFEYKGEAMTYEVRGRA